MLFVLLYDNNVAMLCTAYKEAYLFSQTNNYSVSTSNRPMDR